jgi:hypothetical protein
MRVGASWIIYSDLQLINGPAARLLRGDHWDWDQTLLGASATADPVSSL